MNNSIFFHSKNVRRAALVSVVALGALGASNGFAAEDTASSDGTVVTPIAIAFATDLNFGEFAADPDTAGTITVSTAGVATGDGVVVVTNDADATAASFDVSGSADASYTITVTDDDLTHTDGTTTMTLATTHDLDATSEDSPATGTLDVGGAQTVYVGGVVDVAAAQLAGAYSGSVTVAVEYN